MCTLYHLVMKQSVFLTAELKLPPNSQTFYESEICNHLKWVAGRQGSQDKKTSGTTGLTVETVRRTACFILNACNHRF